MPIKIPKPVFDGITAVRNSGLTNMLDRNAVAKIAMDMDFHEATLWVNDNRDLYSQGIFQGFEAEEESETQKG